MARFSPGPILNMQTNQLTESAVVCDQCYYVEMARWNDCPDSDVTDRWQQDSRVSNGSIFGIGTGGRCGVMFWVFLVFMALWYWWKVGLFRAQSTSLPAIGFWASCMEPSRTGGGPGGELPTGLNAAAARYVAMVYGYRQAGKFLRRVMAAWVFLGVFFLYTFLVAYVAGSGRWFFLGTMALTVAFFSLAFLLWCWIRWKFWKAKIPVGRVLAIREIDRIRRGAHGPAVDRLFKALRIRSLRLFWWWPYAQGRGRLFWRLGQVLVYGLPIALGVLGFLRLYAGRLVSHGDVRLASYVIWAAAFASEWLFLIPAMIWWGDWRGAMRSTWESFPLYILIQDMADLLGG
jgi:hypothetical protein